MISFTMLYHPLKETLDPFSFHSRQAPHGLCPQPSATNLPSITMNFPVMDISHEWNHTICGIYAWRLSLGPTFFEILPYRNMYQCSILFDS